MVSSLKRLYELHPVARGLSVEGHCRQLMGDVLPAWINRERIRRYMRVFTLASTSENDAAAIAGRARRLFFAGERT